MRKAPQSANFHFLSSCFCGSFSLGAFLKINQGGNSKLMSTGGKYNFIWKLRMPREQDPTGSNWQHLQHLGTFLKSRITQRYWALPACFPHSSQQLSLFDTFKAPVSFTEGKKNTKKPFGSYGSNRRQTSACSPWISLCPGWSCLGNPAAERSGSQLPAAPCGAEQGEEDPAVLIGTCVCMGSPLHT